MRVNWISGQFEFVGLPQKLWWVAAAAAEENYKCQEFSLSLSDFLSSAFYFSYQKC